MTKHIPLYKTHPYMTYDGTLCHLSVACKNSKGHAVVWHDGKSHAQHILVFKQHYGVNPSKFQVVHHKCEHKSCVNPEHLELKTRGVHSKDHNTGEGNGNSKLTETAVLNILEHLKTHESSAIAKFLGVSRGCIDGIKFNKTWKHVSRG